MQESKFSLCLTALEASGAEFILVGGLAAVLQGVPIQTYDIDIVYSRARETVEKLLTGLNSMEAIFRIRPTELTCKGGDYLNLIKPARRT